MILHGHLDVVPAHAEQFEPRIEGDRLIGRGAYDMKGALAAMMCAVHDAAAQDARPRALRLRARRGVRGRRRPLDRRARRARACAADFAITGEPTDLHIGVQAKGVLAVRVEVSGIAAHGSTPWLGDNAILKAHDVFRRIETLPFSRESSDLFDRPSINLARIEGGDAFNKVPDRCAMDVDIRYLPEPGPRRDPRPDPRDPRRRDRQARFTARAGDRLAQRTRTCARCATRSAARSRARRCRVGRDGASDAISFLEAGIPAVEFGPVGGGHHGPEEWVSISSLRALPPGARRLRRGPARVAGARAAAGRRARRAAAPRRRPG